MAPTRKAPGVGHQLGRDTFASTGKSQRKSRSSKVLNDPPPTGNQDGGLRMEAVALSPKTSSTCHKRASYLSLDSFVVKPIHLHPSNVLEGFEVNPFYVHCNLIRSVKYDTRPQLSSSRISSMQLWLDLDYPKGLLLKFTPTSYVLRLYSCLPWEKAPQS